MPNRERRITWPPKGIYYFIVDQEWKIFELLLNKSYFDLFYTIFVVYIEI